jgi:hypothetical protein
VISTGDVRGARRSRRALRLCAGRSIRGRGSARIPACPALILARRPRSERHHLCLAVAGRGACDVELRRALAYRKLRTRILKEEADAVVELRRSAVVAPDPAGEPPIRSADPDDDHLIALAAAHDALLVSGDRHLLSLSGRAPVLSAMDLLDRVRNR